MDLLIIAPTYDPHAQIVAWAASALGRAGRVVDFGQLATDGRMICGGSPARYRLDPEPDERVRLEEVGTLWIRRRSPVYFDASTHPDDQRFAGQSWDLLTESFVLAALDDCAFVANDPARARSAILKPRQLHAATMAGLIVPDTVITNDATVIEDFVRSNEAVGHATIVKPLTHMKWQPSDGGVANANTALVRIEDLDGANLAGCPMIYQQEVRKDYEVRLLVCGKSYIAAKIPQQAGDGATDWRSGQDRQALRCEAIEVPDAVLRRAFALMERLGLVTSSMDFIVRPGGEWVFLESNEGGNFAWLEVVNPDLPALDMFAKFLLSRDRDFRYDGNRTVTMKQFDAQQPRYSASMHPKSNPNGGTRAVVEHGPASPIEARRRKEIA